MKFKVGQSASIQKTFTAEDVRLFAELSQDTNPIHLDESWARQSLVGRRIVHGFLYSSLISAAIATKLPGPGSIYLRQDLQFLKPVFLDEAIVARVEVKKIIDEKGHLILTTQCFRKDDLVVDGEARVKF